MQFSVLGFGGAEIGFDNSVTRENVTRLLNSALDAGLNVIDTAAAYQSSEKMIGEAVGKRRKEFYLLTKCGALEGFAKEDWSKKGILETIENSLRNLKTDYLDIAQLHSCDSDILRRGEAIEGLQRAVEKGYTRFIGYSGDNEDAKYALEMGVFDSLQTSVSIADQTPIEGFEQDDYIENSNFNSTPLAEITDELLLTRKANLIFFKNLSEDAWLRTGTANNAEISVRALAYIMVGHVRHHLNILKTRYLT